FARIKSAATRQTRSTVCKSGWKAAQVRKGRPCAKESGEKERGQERSTTDSGQVLPPVKKT
ncbi:MAG: hypothetical protein M1398_02860, partial [Deltaproteobacteria bacterium]|nr:hypothetical protein [Deltaproteobacteria bacterium]